ncbi:MAG: hypothetical protein ACOC7U_02220, partial [Spirochaetota bacterium]
MKENSTSQTALNQNTPMMRQYHSIKRQYPDSILLFRLGDFYEMFEKDAAAASRILNISLTKRNGVPMCGFPFHASNSYIAKLLDHGQKIAICEQKEDPAVSKGIVKREVVEVLSPGIITNPDFLTGESNNCVAALYGGEGKWEVFLACASMDISTGEFLSSCFRGSDIEDNLLIEIDDNGIREILYPQFFHGSGALSGMLERIGKLRS